MRLAIRLFPFAAFVLAACGGQSCSCLQPIKGGFPTDGRRHDNALQIRVTQGAVDYLQLNGKGLVNSLLPMGSTFDIPPSCGGKNEVCCANPQPKCTLDIAVQDVILKPKAPNALAFAVRTQLVSKAPIPVAFDFGLGKSHCLVSIDTKKGTQGHKDIDIAADVTFTVDATTHLTSINMANTDILNLDKSMLDLAAINPLADFACTLVQNVSFIKDEVIKQLKKSLVDNITKAADDAFCAKCKMLDECAAFADECKSGACMRKGKCLQEIGAAGKLDVGALFASLSPGTVAGMDTLAVLGAYADVQAAPNGGISLGMIGGGQGDPHNACVPMRPAPMVPTVGKWAAATGQVEPQTKKPYHIGLGIHESHLRTMGYAAFDAGALCLRVGTPTVAMLNTSTVGLLMPSLADLVHVNNAPMFLVMRPQQEPVITIGAGTFTVENGKKKIVDPLLRIDVPKFAIDFYAFFDDRYVRILTLTADLSIPVMLDVDAMGQIVPIIDLDKAFKNVRVSNSELLKEAPEQLAKAFPPLLGTALGGVTSGLKPVALPAVMGLDLKIVAIEPTDGNKFLSFFTTIALASPETFHAETEAAVGQVLMPPTEAFRVDRGLDPLVAPRVELLLSGFGIDGTDRDLEWSVSFDGATWSPWMRGPAQTVAHPTLWLQGRHHVDVRARMMDDPATTDPTPVRLEFLVDTVAPEGVFELRGDEARFTAHDAVSPSAALEYRFRAGGEWSVWSRGDHFALVALAGGLAPSDVEVEARDEAGNAGKLDFHGRTTTPAAGGCSCTVAGEASGAEGLWSVLALCALLTALRVRRGTAASLLVLLVAAAGLCASACHHASDDAPPLTKNDFLDPIDEIGRYSDAVARSGKLHVSAYDDSLGDLAYAEIDLAKLDREIQWQWVDGVPTDQPAGDTMSFRKGIAEPGDDVGLHTSIALGEGGNPRIAYHDSTNKQLKFARAEGRVFVTGVVDKLAAGRAGLYASLSLDSAGIPSIAYAAVDLPDGNGGFLAKLRLATAKSPTPSSPADWNILDLDQTAIPCAGLCAANQACIPLDPKDKTKKSVCKGVDQAPCPKPCSAGQACLGAACVAYLEPVKAPDLVEGTGLFARLLRFKAGGRGVVYYDHQQGDLKLALEASGGAFGLSVIDGNDPATDVGQFAAAMVAPDDTIHVAYVDAIADRLLYKAAKGAVAAMAPEVIDDGARMDGPHSVGASAALWTDGTTVQVAYQDQQLADLFQATRTGATWAKGAVGADAVGHGFYPHIVSDGGRRYLTEFVYDRDAQLEGRSLGFLVVSALP
ncbi:MAG: hypothetical protein EXR72_21150 [Myxococcales bacterium]|nr:hypothetical protein [Myxococcales bacterium]